MPLEQRQVLVRRGVEDDVGLDVREDLVDPLAVPDVGDDAVVAVQQSLAEELELEPVEVGLVVVEHDQLAAVRSRTPGGTARMPIEPPGTGDQDDAGPR